MIIIPIDKAKYELQIIAGTILAFVSAIASSIFIYRFVAAKKDFFAVGPDGIQDKRLADAIIPWSAIRAISVWSKEDVSMAMLEIDEKWLGQTGQPKAARIMKAGNSLVDAKGDCLNHTDFDVEFDELLPTLRDYAEAYDAPAAINGKLPG